MLLALTLPMNRFLKWCLIIEVICVFLPIAVMLFLGYLWSFIYIVLMLIALKIDLDSLNIMLLTFLGTLWLIGIMKLTIMSVYDNNEVFFENHNRTIIYMAAGCLLYILTLFDLSLNFLAKPVNWFLIFPVIVSFQLLWLNRKGLRNDS